MYLVFLCPEQTDTKQEWTDRYWDQLKFRILIPRKLFPISIEVPNEVDRQSMTVKQLLKKYQVKTFPTVLIISPSGKVLMRNEGAPTLSLNDYVAAIKKAITPKTLKDRFKK